MRFRFRLSLILLVCVIFALVLTLAREPIRKWLGMNPNDVFPLVEIDNPHILDEALQRERAAIFASVDWSGSALRAKAEFRESARLWNADRANPMLGFYVIDLTDGRDWAPDRIANWLNSDKRMNLVGVSWVGEIVWLQYGKIARVANCTLGERLMDTEPAAGGK